MTAVGKILDTGHELFPFMAEGDIEGVATAPPPPRSIPREVHSPSPSLFLVPPAPAPETIANPTLGDRINQVDLIIETLESLDDETLGPALREQLTRELITAIAGTRKKVDATNNVLAMYEGLEASGKAEIVRLEKRVKYFARQRERLEEHTIAVMTASKLDHLDGEISTFKLRKNPARVMVDERANLPAEFLRFPDPPPPTPDKSLIKAALDAGRKICGCWLAQGQRLVRA